LKKIFVPLILPLLFCGCVEEVTIQAPPAQIQPVVNAIATPDSSFSVYCSFSQAMNATELANADNAKVSLYSGNSEIGVLDYVSDSMYFLNYSLKSGLKYNLNIEIPGYPAISASDSVPFPADVSDCYYHYPTGYDESGKAIGTAYFVINDDVNTKDYYEIKFLDWEHFFRDSVEGRWLNLLLLKSEDAIFLEEGSKAFYPASYFFSDSLINGTSHTFSFDFVLSGTMSMNGKLITSGMNLIVVVRKTSQNYYNYKFSRAKQAFTQSLYEVQDNSNFTSSYLAGNNYNIVGNITNGMGIFATYVSTSKELKYRD
jgi:hypothetical protein